MLDCTEKACVYCSKDAPALTPEEQHTLLKELNDWQVVDHHHLEKVIETGRFTKGLELVNSIGEIAEDQGHHPDLHLSFTSLRITIWTHAIDGLTRGDYILAKHIDTLLQTKI